MRLRGGSEEGAGGLGSQPDWYKPLFWASVMHRPDCEFRDAVHGFVRLSKAERRIVDTPTFQRLRDIKQLAMGHLVYPGAVHTRFEHSIGCVHIASSILQAIRLRHGSGGDGRLARAFHVDDPAVERGTKILRLAALLHDVGHPPFSHSGEGLLPVIKHEDGKLRPLDHEMMTASLIRETEIGEVIKDEFGAHGISIEEVIGVATKPPLSGTRFDAWLEFLNEILAGELGADRIDYLLRDAHHSGQRAGAFDYQKLIDSMQLVPAPEQTHGAGGFRLGLDEGGWLVAEQMVVARYLMYVALYFHKTKRIYELHLTDFIKNWLELTTKHGTWPHSVADYAAMTDSRVLAAIRDAGLDPNHPLRHLAAPFVNRSHLRLARELVLADNYRAVRPIETDNSARGLVAGDTRRTPDIARFDLLCRDVRGKFGIESVRHDSAGHKATDMFSRDDRILVSLANETRHLPELSEVVRGMSSKIWRGRIYARPEIRQEVADFCARWLSEHPMQAGAAPNA